MSLKLFGACKIHVFLYFLVRFILKSADKHFWNYEKIHLCKYFNVHKTLEGILGRFRVLLISLVALVLVVVARS